MTTVCTVNHTLVQRKKAPHVDLFVEALNTVEVGAQSLDTLSKQALSK